MYRCNCKAGFARVGDIPECVDVDECLSESACPKNSECQNFDGGFNCACAQGYVENDSTFDVEPSSGCAREITVSYTGDVEVEIGLTGKFIMQEGEINGKPHWKHESLETFIFAAPSVSHHNWHVYNQLGNSWAWVYANPNACPHETEGARHDFRNKK